MKEDIVYLVHIRDSIQEIEEFLGGQSFIGADRKTYLAILHVLQNIGESVKNLSPVLKEKYPTIPWRKIADFRNVIVHDYLGDIDEEIVDQVIQKRLPELKKAILELIGG